MTITVGRVRAALSGRSHRPATLRGDERFAAVAAVLREREGEAEVLLIRRAENVGDPWSGHMAFPGGRQDPGDPDMLHTALRETHEEIGLRLEAGTHLIGRLDDLAAVARGRRVGLVVAPFVFAIEGDPTLVPSAEEVDEVVWANLSALSLGLHDTRYTYVLGEQIVDLPGFAVGKHVVWGMTHRMLVALLATLDGRNRESYETRA